MDDGATHTADVDAILPLEDSTTVVSGNFQHMGGLERANLARLIGGAGAADGNVSSLVKGTAGAVIAGGAFPVAGATLTANLARLGSGGIADTAHTPAHYAQATVQTIFPDSAYGFICGGVFDWAGTERQCNVLRLDASGHFDSSSGLATKAPYPQTGGIRRPGDRNPAAACLRRRPVFYRQRCRTPRTGADRRSRSRHTSPIEKARQATTMTSGVDTAEKPKMKPTAAKKATRKTTDTSVVRAAAEGDTRLCETRQRTYRASAAS